MGRYHKKYEIENYLHTEAIRRGHGVSMHVNDHPETIGGKLQTVGNVFSAAHFDMKKTGAPMNEDTAKKKLSKAFQYMTADFVRQRDPEGEVIGWMIKLGELARLE